MADTIQTHLPPEFTPLVDEIREERIKRREGKTNMDIIKDAVKLMHKTYTKGRK